MRIFIHKAQQQPKRIVFPEGEEEKILRAAQIVMDEEIAKPILLGDKAVIQQKIAELGLDLEGVEIIDPAESPKFEAYVVSVLRDAEAQGRDALRRRRYVADAQRLRHDDGAATGDADGLVSGLTQHYPETIRPALQIIGKRDGVSRSPACTCWSSRTRRIHHRRHRQLRSDRRRARRHRDPDRGEGAAASTSSRGIAMLSFSNFGSTQHPLAEKMARAP